MLSSTDFPGRICDINTPRPPASKDAIDVVGNTVQTPYVSVSVSHSSSGLSIKLDI